MNKIQHHHNDTPAERIRREHIRFVCVNCKCLTACFLVTIEYNGITKYKIINEIIVHFPASTNTITITKTQWYIIWERWVELQRIYFHKKMMCIEFHENGLNSSVSLRFFYLIFCCCFFFAICSSGEHTDTIL